LRFQHQRRAQFRVAVVAKELQQNKDARLLQNPLSTIMSGVLDAATTLNAVTLDQRATPNQMVASVPDGGMRNSAKR
jgi:hypothetical protein